MNMTGIRGKDAEAVVSEVPIGLLIPGASSNRGEGAFASVFQWTKAMGHGHRCGLSRDRD